MTTPNYGVFAELVAASSSIIAAGAAIRLTWKGRAKFEPDEQDVPQGAQRVGGLITAVLIGLLWYAFSIQKSILAPEIMRLALWLLGLGLFSLLIYGVLIGVYVYEKETAIDGVPGPTIKIVGGYWLTPAARKNLLDLPAVTVQEQLKGAGYRPDIVWPRLSRALAKASFQLGYISLVGSSTLALTAVALLISSAMNA